MGENLSARFANELNGILNCYDRIVITGNVPTWCYAKGMTGYLYQQNIRIFDYAKFVEPFRGQIRDNAERLAKESGIAIEFVRSGKNFRKETRIQAILKERGEAPGLVHIFSAMESCPSYQPWHDKQTGKTFLRADSGKCLHYYFYFIDEELGLCYLRLPTWAPFRLQFYFNGHNWLAAQLKANGIAFEMVDNAFVEIADFEKANELAKKLDVERLSQRLDRFANLYCPVVSEHKMSYYWSIMQAEYATDLVFKKQDTLQAFYPHLLETLTHAVKPADIATFLGRKLNGNYQGEMGNRFNRRWLGSRIKHQMGPVSIKMYDKFSLVLRIETTVNNVTFFKQYRQVDKRDGTTVTKWAPMKKTIFSLPPLQEVLLAANQRYIKFISSIATPEVGAEKLHQLAETKTENNHRYKGFNLFSEEDTCLFRTLLQGEFAISGFTNKQLRQYLARLSPSQITRLIARLRVHGIIKKVAKGYKYYLTDLGRQLTCMALKLREMVIIPELALPVTLHA
jgi:hypothetical protein